MSLSPDLMSVVDALVAARLGPAPAPLALAAAMRTAGDAYAVQDAVAQRMGWAASTPPRWWKSGGPSRSGTQTHAALPPAGVWTSPADDRGTRWRLRGIEIEVALRLGQDVAAAQAQALDVDAARRLVDAMCVSIELIDARWDAGLDATPLAKLADLQSHGALVLGEWRPFDAARDWSAQACTVTLGERGTQRFVGTHSMGDPAWVLPAWLRHATRGGGVLPAGTVVTTGTWCGIVHALPGETVVARFDGIGEARVRFGG